MAQRSSHIRFPVPARVRRPGAAVRLRCEGFETRITPAQFTAQPAITLAAGVLNNNGCVATADFNKDGRMDAVMTNYGTNENNNDGTTIVQLMGRATPGFNVRTFSTSPGNTASNVSYVSVADINGDTWPDVLVSNANQQGIGSVSVFRNDANGAGTLTLVGTPFPTGGNNASWVGAADFTGDGILDVAVAHFGRLVTSGGEQTLVGNKVTVFQGNDDGTGRGNFTYNGPIATLAPTVQGVVTMVPTALALADFDGDTFVDIVAVSPGIPPETGAPYPEGSVYQFKGNGIGGFAAPNQIDSGGDFPINVQAADLNGDGKKDLVIANTGDPGLVNQLTYSWTDNSIGVMLNLSTPGSMQFDFANPLTANIRGPFATAVTDFNLDGRPDIAAVNYGAPDGPFVTNPTDAFVTVYLGSATVPGQFVLASPAQYDTLTGDGGGQSLAVGDFSGDGAPDLIVAHDNNKIGLLFNTSTPSVRPTVSGVAVNAGQSDLTQRSKVTSIKVTFNTQVTFAGPVAAAFGLSRIGGGAVGSFTATATVVDGKTEVTLTGFTGAETEFGSLADGRYSLLVRANQVTANGFQLDGNGDGTSGDDHTLNGTVANKFFRLFGDANADGAINAADFGQFIPAYGTGTGQTAYVAWFDFDGDGTINALDFAQVRRRFGSGVP